jgi:hypothetical protein
MGKKCHHIALLFAPASREERQTNGIKRFQADMPIPFIFYITCFQYCNWEKGEKILMLTFRKVFIVFAVGLFCVLALASLVSAQETGTLIVYEESQGGDATFSFTGSGSLGSFQIATEQGGGAQLFDLPVGTYTVTQNSLPSGWSTQEVFADGTETTSTDLTQSKATFTVSSAADVIYCRFTNTKAAANPTPAASPTPSPSIPENIGLPLLLVVVAGVTSVLVLLAKKKGKAAPMLAVLLSILMITSFIGSANANPDKYIQLGTKENDEQFQFGTPNRDVIVQLGFGGNDSQYGEGQADADVIVQNGGAGYDGLTVITGSGDDFVVQDAGDSSDAIYCEHGDGDLYVAQYGGKGDDTIEMQGGEGNGNVTVRGGEGKDRITVKGNTGDAAGYDSNLTDPGVGGYDIIKIDAGLGDDNVEYTNTYGVDSVVIDGGAGNDFLTISQYARSLVVLDDSGTVLYSNGSQPSTIRTLNFEHGQVLGDDLKVVFQW